MENYNKVSIYNLKQEDFKGPFGFDDFALEEFNKDLSDYEKAVIYATYILRSEDSTTYYNTIEVGNALIEAGVISKTETFEMIA